MAARITQVLAEEVAHVRAAVERDDPRLVDHLVMDHDVVRRLDQHDVAVVGAARDSRQPLRHAALPQAAVGPRVGAAASFESAGGTKRPDVALAVLPRLVGRFQEGARLELGDFLGGESRLAYAYAGAGAGAGVASLTGGLAPPPGT